MCDNVTNTMGLLRALYYTFIISREPGRTRNKCFLLLLLLLLLQNWVVDLQVAETKDSFSVLFYNLNGHGNVLSKTALKSDILKLFSSPQRFGFPPNVLAIYAVNFCMEVTLRLSILSGLRRCSLHIQTHHWQLGHIKRVCMANLFPKGGCTLLYVHWMF